MRFHADPLKWPRWLAVATALVLFSIGPAAHVQGQEADEATAEEPTGEEPAMADDAVPEEPTTEDLPTEEESPAKAAPKPPSGDAEATPEPALPDDPAVQAVLESHPKTPAQLLRAIDILVDLGHPKLARPFVDQFAQAKLDLTAKAALAQQFHSATLLKLASSAELAEVLAPLIDDLIRSAEAYRRDPQRLTQWARQLGDPDESVRAQAVLALVRAREAAVAPLVAILADPGRAGEHAAARSVVVQLGDLAIEPLLGVLESPDAALKTQVAAVLGQLRASQAVASLLGPLVLPSSTPALQAAAAEALEKIGGDTLSRTEALRLLEQAARRSLDESRRDRDDVPTPKEVWHWNAKAGQSMPIIYEPTAASLAVAVRLARDLYRFNPTDGDFRRLYLTALLQAAKFRGGLDKPLPTGAGTAYSVAAHYGPAVVEEVLVDALARGYFPAATAAAEILGDIGQADVLAHGGSAGSPLAQAAAHADRRLRFAAIGAIMKLHPTRPFAGSSHVADGLGFFAASYGAPRVLVVHPRSEEAQKLAGLAAGLGYATDIATNGRRAFELAVSSPDHEFALIHSAIDRPRADELVAQLRRDRRTALMPLGLVAPLDDLERVARFARSASRVEALLQPQNPAEMELYAARLQARAGQRLTAAERKHQAIAALDWLAALGDQSQSLFDLGRQESSVMQVLYVPELSARAATVLGQMPSAKSQRSLLELADLATQPRAARAAAAAAFARSVRAHGILLSRGEILEQYALYNANAGRDADTSAVLGAILDAIEDRGESAGGTPSRP